MLSIYNKFLTVAVLMLSISLRYLIKYFSRLTLQVLHNYLSRPLGSSQLPGVKNKLHCSHHTQGKNHILMKIARPICRTKAAMGTMARSFVCTKLLRFNVTKAPDIAPVSNMTIHLINSTGMIKRNCHIKRQPNNPGLSNRRELLKSLRKFTIRC